jgi:prepilin-type N-terminal cleavage/methylation domain-containing protein
MRTSARNGFTLIELLTAVSLIAILISLTLPALSKVRSQLSISRCSSNLRNIGIAATGYAGDYDGFFPPSFTNPNTWMWAKDKFGGPHGLGFLADGYLDQTSVLACPSTNLNNVYGNFKNVRDFTQNYIGYRYIANGYLNSNIDYFTGPTSSDVRGPNFIPTFYFGVSKPSVSNLPFVYDIISENLLSKWVFHPHPHDMVARASGPNPAVKGGNLLYVDMHVRFHTAENWIQNGPYGRYIPFWNL